MGHFPLSTLGPDRYVPVSGMEWLKMKITEDQQKPVVFFGYADTNKPGGINCIGTGFLLEYENVGYLVTAKHLSCQLGSDPFLIRLNKKDGTSENLHADKVPWFEHPDPTVDVSVIVFHIGNTLPYDVIYLSARGHLLKEQLADEDIRVGCLTYTLGLFRLLSGEKRNLPVCHFGIISLLPEDEKIPVKDWDDPKGEKTKFVEGYLVESQSLAGLSGSPVMVRPEFDIDFGNILNHPEDIKKTIRPSDSPAIAAPRSQLRLLGVWQGAWEAPPDEVRSAQNNDPIKVPVGMGVVVPCYKIVEVLELPEVKKQRDEFNAKREIEAAELQTAKPVKKKKKTKKK